MMRLLSFTVNGAGEERLMVKACGISLLTEHRNK
jgi:hypothetical protein